LPVLLSLAKALAAMVAGNTVVLKPSPFTPLTVLRISDHVRVLLPAGVLNTVTGGDERAALCQRSLPFSVCRCPLRKYHGQLGERRDKPACCRGCKSPTGKEVANPS